MSTIYKGKRFINKSDSLVLLYEKISIAQFEISQRVQCHVYPHILINYQNIWNVSTNECHADFKIYIYKKLTKLSTPKCWGHNLYLKNYL